MAQAFTSLKSQLEGKNWGQYSVGWSPRDHRIELRPSRAAAAARRGVTLVELMISMLILTIVCISWLQIIGIQSARKEARRREAVERLAGMMDAFLYCTQNVKHSRLTTGGYKMTVDVGGKVALEKEVGVNEVYPVFENGESPIGYRLLVVEIAGLRDEGLPVELFKGWDLSLSDGIVPRWMVGKLYDRSNCSVNDAGRPFFTLPVCLGF